MVTESKYLLHVSSGHLAHRISAHSRPTGIMAALLQRVQYVPPCNRSLVHSRQRGGRAPSIASRAVSGLRASQESHFFGGGGGGGGGWLQRGHISGLSMKKLHFGRLRIWPPKRRQLAQRVLGTVTLTAVPLASLQPPMQGKAGIEQVQVVPGLSHFVHLP